MPQSESTLKTSAPTTKRSHISTIVNQVIKIFVPSKHTQEASPNPKNCMYFLILYFHYYFQYLVFVLPSISVTTPEGQTIAVDE